MTTLIAWVPNGFDPQTSDRLDEFSRNSLEQAIREYHKHRALGDTVYFVYPRSIVRHPDGTLLHEAMRREIERTFVPDENGIGMRVPSSYQTRLESFNAITDAEALALFARDLPGSGTIVVAFCKEVVPYFTAVYGNYRYFEGHEWRFEMVGPNEGPRPDARSRRLYKFAHLVTRLASISRPTFRLYAALRERTDRHRLQGFLGTVSTDRV